MRQVDYIVVGLGVAGVTFCEQLSRGGKSFVVIDKGTEGATAVAGGVVNPVVLKRFTAAWNSAAFIEEALPFYTNLQQKLTTTFVNETPIHRIFNNPQEQNDWMVASDSSKLSSFLSSEILAGENNCVQTPFGMGQVNQGFRVDTKHMLHSYRIHLEYDKQLLTEEFDHSRLQVEEDELTYGKISAKKIVFAQGAAVVQNPFFKPDTLIPKKGEYIIFKSPQLKLKSVLKGPFFVIPLGNDLYKAGATFVHGEVSFDFTAKSRKQIEAALDKMISCPYEVVDQEVGLRPTVKDRRPLLGAVENNRIAFLAGLGTRGILMAPLLARKLYTFLENGEELAPEIDLQRYL